MSASASPDVGEAASALHRLLRQRGATIATAESITGGALAAALTSVPGASATYVGGVVSYATSVKVGVLGVSQAIVDGPGVISADCATAMAEGARAITGATYAMSTTGVAGPDLQEGHHAGTVFVGIAGPQGAQALLLDVPGDRAGVIAATVVEALSVAARMIGSREETALG